MSKILYHYTNMDGFIGMLSSKNIWISNAIKSNDSMESGVFNEKLLKKFLRKMPEYETKKIINIYKKYIDESNNENYIFCLTESQDLLSQWRGYADNGEGVQLGFDFNSLLDIAHDYDIGEQIMLENDSSDVINPFSTNDSFFSFYLDKCLYTEEEKFKELTNKLDFAHKIPKEIFNKYYEDDVKQYLENKYGRSNYSDYIEEKMFEVFRTLECTFKHPAFLEEKEWRLMLNLSKEMKTTYSKYNSIKYRSSNNNIVSYFSIDFENEINKGIIKEICFGPKSPVNPYDPDINGFLEENGYQIKIKISKSSAPYR